MLSIKHHRAGVEPSMTRSTVNTTSYGAVRTLKLRPQIRHSVITGTSQERVASNNPLSMPFDF